MGTGYRFIAGYKKGAPGFGQQFPVLVVQVGFRYHGRAACMYDVSLRYEFGALEYGGEIVYSHIKRYRAFPAQRSNRPSHSAVRQGGDDSTVQPVFDRGVFMSYRKFHAGFSRPQVDQGYTQSLQGRDLREPGAHHLEERLVQPSVDDF